MRLLRWLAVVGLLVAFSGWPQFAHLHCCDHDHSADTCAICQTLAILKVLVLVVPVSLIAALCPIFIFRLPEISPLLQIPAGIFLARAPPLS